MKKHDMSDKMPMSNASKHLVGIYSLHNIWMLKADSHLFKWGCLH